MSEEGQDWKSISLDKPPIEQLLKSLRALSDEERIDRGLDEPATRFELAEAILQIFEMQIEALNLFAVIVTHDREGAKVRATEFGESTKKLGELAVRLLRSNQRGGSSSD